MVLGKGFPKELHRRVWVASIGCNSLGVRVGGLSVHGTGLRVHRGVGFRVLSFEVEDSGCIGSTVQGLGIMQGSRSKEYFHDR